MPPCPSPSSSAAAPTNPSAPYSASGIPAAANSVAVNRRTCETPARMSRQYCSGVSAPGNLSAIPITAMRFSFPRS